jgi:signal transduction histidine kinase
MLDEKPADSSGSGYASRIADLEKELSAAHARMQAMLKERDAAYEEYRAANEDLRVTNEELRHSNNELRRSQEELQVTNKDLKKANQGLLIANEQLRLQAGLLKNEFLSIAAHELRTPLAVLKGFVQMLIVQTQRGKGPQLAEWQNEALQDIDYAVMRLDNLIDELLDVEHLQTGRFILYAEPMDLVSAVRRVVAQQQLTTEQHRFIIKIEQEPVPINADQGRIERVLSNLLSNAIKYSPDGGPVVVSIRRRDEIRDVLLSVQDYGIGVPAHQQDRIFGRFVRAENAQIFGIEGTGLGLFICRELIEWHRGHIWFTSTEGRGSTFYISLPLAPGVVKEPLLLPSHIETCPL